MIRAKLPLLLFVAAIASSADAKTAKNVILLIGDGMGPPQVTLGLVYARQSPDSPYKEKGLNIEQMMRTGRTGFMLTYPQGNLIVDSAASATQLATGAFAGSEMIGVDHEGNRRETILERAHRAGKATGLVSSARLTHATPASFAAHVPHRSLENQIAEQMVASGTDVMLSAGYRYFLPRSVEKEGSEAHARWSKRIPGRLASSRPDDKDLLGEAERLGYELVFDHAAMVKAKGRRLLGLFGTGGMPTGIAEAVYENDPNRRYPTLRDMTRKALEILSKDPEGFFLMVEGGQIDWAGHANDAGWMLNEILQFDKAIGEVLDFARKHPDTLVILTADHETGSFGFSYSKNDVPTPRKLTGDAFKDALFAPEYNFGDPQVLAKLRRQSRPIGDILYDFDKLPPKERTPETLARLVTEGVGFPLTVDEAREILGFTNSPAPKGSVILAEFKNTFASDVRGNLIGHALSKEQQVVWGTGTHTMSFVPLIAFGAGQEAFQGVMHSTEVNHAMTKAMGLKAH